MIRRARRAQVLVYPWVRPGSLALVAGAVLALAVWAMVQDGSRPAEPDHVLTPRNGMYLQIPARAAAEDCSFQRIDSVYYTSSIGRPSAFVRPGVFVAGRTGTLSAKVLANTLQLGSDGPLIPIAVGFARDGGALSDAALGPGLFAGHVRTLSMRAGERVAFVSAPRYDEAGTGGQPPLHRTAAHQVRSDVPGGFADAPFVPRCLMILDGDPVPYATRPGFDGQPSLAQILAPLIGRDGRVHLGPDRAILAYEYTSHFRHPAADFQDLVLMVKFMTRP